MRHEHYLSSTYVRLLIQANQQFKSLIADEIQLPFDTLLREPFIDGTIIDQIIELFYQHGLDSWVLRHNKQLGVSSHGPLGFAVLTAPDLETAIRTAADYSIIRLSYYDCKFRHRNSRAEFIFNNQTQSSLTSRWMIESGIFVVKQLIETIVSHPLGNNAVIQFKHSAPSYKAELEKLYGINCLFNQRINTISIPYSWCQISSPLSEPATFNSNLRKCHELKQQLANEQDIITSTRLILSNHFEQSNNSSTQQLVNHAPSLTSLAEQRNMSPRTFARHLEKHNSSYRKILEEVRQQQACILLKSTHLSVADIGARLGYLESANFIRAFKTWFSCSPTQWRRENH